MTDQYWQMTNELGGIWPLPLNRREFDMNFDILRTQFGANAVNERASKTREEKTENELN